LGFDRHNGGDSAAAGYRCRSRERTVPQSTVSHSVADDSVPAGYSVSFDGFDGSSKRHASSGRDGSEGREFVGI
jgi:hypothetical protein